MQNAYCVFSSLDICLLKPSSTTYTLVNISYNNKTTLLLEIFMKKIKNSLVVSLLFFSIRFIDAQVWWTWQTLQFSSNRIRCPCSLDSGRSIGAWFSVFGHSCGGSLGYRRTWNEEINWIYQSSFIHIVSMNFSFFFCENWCQDDLIVSISTYPVHAKEPNFIHLDFSDSISR